MLAIRFQRIGRKKLPMYRLAVQESQRHPSSGRVVAYAGSYNPHTKEAKLDVEKLNFYLKNGAQPTPRVVKLIIADKGVEVPAWVKQPRTDVTGAIRNPEKLRRNQPKEAPAAEPAAEKPADEPAEAEAPKEA